MEKVTIETPAQEAEENKVDVMKVTASPPSLGLWYAMFRPTQKSAFLCNLLDASSYLQRALHVSRDAIRKSNATAQQQMLITEMLPKLPEVILPIEFCQHELVRIRDSAEIAALYEGSTISRPPCIIVRIMHPSQIPFKGSPNQTDILLQKQCPASTDKPPHSNAFEIPRPKACLN